MATPEQLQPLFERALDDAGSMVLRAAGADLRAPTPCADWDLRALLGHMIGQNEGFAAAVRGGDAPLTAYAAPVITAGELPQLWDRSAERLRSAFRDAVPDTRVRLAELDREVPVETALGMQVVDCAVHAWDVATALGQDYRPTDAVAGVVLGSARVIAGRLGGTPGVFAAPREADGADPWSDALRLLGR